MKVVVKIDVFLRKRSKLETHAQNWYFKARSVRTYKALSEIISLLKEEKRKKAFLLNFLIYLYISLYVDLMVDFDDQRDGVL